VAAEPGQLYLAAISSKPYRNTVAVSGLGLAWTELVDQCSGRSQTGMSLWWARGSPSASGPVTATLASVAENGVLAVSRYAGVAPSGPVGSVLGANSNGTGGACTGGIDAASYSFPLATLSSNALLHAAVGIRQRTHTPGAGYTERVEVLQGTGGSAAGLAAEDRPVPLPGTASVQGSSDSTVDWAAAAVELVEGQ
jgi:hypothetical protein